jgi:glycosyltransferase involved in cell wall biosynthesis
MRIAIVSQNAAGLFLANSSVSFGGSETGISLIARELAKRGHELHIFCDECAKNEIRIVDGITLHLLPKSKNLGFALVHSFLYYLNLVIQMKRCKPDLIYQAGSDPITGILSFYSKCFRVPFIHRIASDLDLLPELSDLIGFRRSKMSKWGQKNASYLITQTMFQKKLLFESLGIDSVHIPNCKVIKKQLCKKRSGVLWVGRMIPEKRVELFLDLAEKLPKIQFTMVGMFVANNSQNLQIKERIASLNNLNHITSLRPDEMDDYYASTSIFVSTSNLEGFPNTFLEASLQCTPIVSIDIDPDDYVKNSKAGMVVVKKDQLLTSVNSILKDPDIGIEMGKRGRAWVIEHYDVRVVSNQYVAIFNKFKKKSD